ncbi:MAG: beta-ketoacyl-ACP synthase II [Spirochaetaceae bacterium]|jgi:3-oxoacyl-[acyl-carrier-protein] synthase II|nr:beta-ketoacyl-ACP synthase II [Spirochaetaceae bacterium]
MSRRVVVTGMGTINPLAHNVKDTWEAAKKGTIGIGPITQFDTEEFPVKNAGEVKDFKASDYMDKKEARKMARFTQFAVAASIEAMKDAGLDVAEYDKDRTGVILGNGIGGLDVTEINIRNLAEKGLRGISPMSIPHLISNEAPANVSIKHGLHGPSFTVTTACASGTDAMGYALFSIRSGLCDIVVTGGTEATITPFGIGGFIKLHALSTNPDPNTCSRPFDKDRDGFVMGEGAGILIFEELEHAQKRGATIYAEVAGYGITCDADHLTAPDPEGKGAAKAMKNALADAGMKPEDIDYINAHGTSTPVNDPVETKAIKLAFGDYAKTVKISSTKAMTAHMLGATGGIEGIFSILAVKEDFMPGTMNLDEADETCDLNYLPNKGEAGTVRAALSESLGFGGHNGAIIFKKYQA